MPAPEGVETELAPELVGEPAGSPLAGTMELEIAQADGDDLVVGDCGQPVIRKERHRARHRMAGHDEVDGLAPGGLLGGVDFAEVKDVPLENTTVGDAPVFNDAPVVVDLAVFLPRSALEKHADRTLCK